jgi:asparagine synthase (glutamine-hydrolysing)
MNVFLFSWGSPTQLHPTMLSELTMMIDIYPNLDIQTLWHFEASDTVFAASIHSSYAITSPRCYVEISEEEVVFYTGFLIDKNKNFSAHNARDLSCNWHKLPNDLEGRFAIIKATKEPCIELFNDCLGVEQVYYFHSKGACFVSNNVHLLAKIGKLTALDELGTSLYLTLGWAGSDRTLLKNIRVIPGGQHWKWDKDHQEPLKRTYFQLNSICRRPSLPLTQAIVKKLATEMVEICQILSNSFGELFCPITGGHDSRLLAALLIHGNISAKYFTTGEPSSTELSVAKQVVEAFSLPHNVNIKTSQDVIQNWEVYSLKLISQNDGMVSLWQIADVYKQRLHTKRQVYLSGAGGEISRGFYSNSKLFHHIHSQSDLCAMLNASLLKNSGNLIHLEVLELSRKYIKQFVQKEIEEEVLLVDIPDIFYVKERVRRWGGSNSRKAVPSNDFFYPLCTRSFVETSFSISALDRYCELLPYELIQYLVPGLHKIPYEKAWRNNLKLGNTHKSSPNFEFVKQKVAFNQEEWINSRLSFLREMCLDQINSPVWDYVNRSCFEEAMSDSFELKERHNLLQNLYNIISLFCYTNN